MALFQPNTEPTGYDQQSPFTQHARRPAQPLGGGITASATTNAAASALGQPTAPHPAAPAPGTPGANSGFTGVTSPYGWGGGSTAAAPTSGGTPWASPNFSAGDVTNYLYRQLISPVNADGSIAPPGQGGPMATYTPMAVGQFQGPDQAQTQGLEGSLINQILGQPETMTPEAVAALKEAQKESALAMQEQQLAGMRQNAAGRGAMGGALDANVRRSNDALVGTLTGAYRDIDLAKIAKDRADQLAALGAAESVLSGQMGRSTQGYMAGLQGQQLQSQENQFAANNQLNWNNSLNNMLMGRYGLGLQYAQLDQQGQNNLMNWLASYFNGGQR